MAADERLGVECPRVALLRLSRNFGNESALKAGLDHVERGAALVMDADGQDPPQLLPQCIAKEREGFDDVHSTRISRGGEGVFKRAAAYVFYRFISRRSKTPIPRTRVIFACCCRVDRRPRQLCEHHRFMKGLFGWIGCNQVAIPPSACGQDCLQQQIQRMGIVEFCAGRHHEFQHRYERRPIWASQPPWSLSPTGAGSLASLSCGVTRWQAGRR